MKIDYYIIIGCILVIMTTLLCFWVDYRKRKKYPIYCGECKHYKEGTEQVFLIGKIDECNHPNNLEETDLYYKRIISHKSTPNKMNLYNNCKLFEGKKNESNSD